MIVFDKQHDLPIIVKKDIDEAILLAVKDLQRNLRDLSGKQDGFEIVNDVLLPGIYVELIHSNDAESYGIKILKDRILITGSDVLGTVYGVYAFATKCLQIQPVYRLVDLFPAQKESLELEEIEFSSAPKQVRFRGWFINDEDLLSELKISGGVRDIDYDFYKDVIDVDVLDMILETALRLEMNMIIPASLVDIDNPDEEKLVQAVCRRGMYISMHHIEPMGVSYFGAEKYLKRNGYADEQLSFIQNRDRMVEIWTYYAKKWSKYASHVIWQLGLRGKGDQAVWQADPNVPDSMEFRGAIITDAINTQYEIIRSVLNTDDFYSTATLWNEGSELCGMGYLKLPANTIPVFADLGLDQMFGEDLYKIGQNMDCKYGVYYHAQFWTLGPHLTEGCNPIKMAYCYKEAAKTGQLVYSILNISNVRPLHISAMMNAAILKEPLTCDAGAKLLSWDKEVFGEFGSQVNEIRKGYYASFADFGTDAVKKTANLWHFYYREYEDLPFIRNAATDGQVAFFGKALIRGKINNKLPDPDATTKALFEKSAKDFEALYRKAQLLEEKLEKDTVLYFQQFIKYPILHMQMLSLWDIVCIDLTDKSLPLEFRQARATYGCECLERILQERVVLEQGQWKHYHRGEKKVNIRELLRLTDLSKDGELYERDVPAQNKNGASFAL